MAIRGFSSNISDKLSGKQATQFAQWIGASNVMRNQKRAEYVALLADGNGNQINQAYAHIRNNTELPFLKAIPVQLMRNAASLIYLGQGIERHQSNGEIARAYDLARQSIAVAGACVDLDGVIQTNYQRLMDMAP